MFYHFELTCYPRLLKFYTVTRNTVWEITEQEHLLIFIREGSCVFSCNGETRTVNSGDIVYIPANQPYIRKSTDHTLCTMTYVHFLTKDSVTEISAPELALHTAGQQKLLDNAILAMISMQSWSSLSTSTFKLFFRTSAATGHRSILIPFILFFPSGC